MDKYQTKYIGEITFFTYDSLNFVSGKAYYKNYEISFLFDKKIFTDKIAICLNIIDRYFEINSITKNEIMNNYLENKKIKAYFKYCFKNIGKENRIKIFFTNKYEEIDFKKVIGKMEYPNLSFKLNGKNNELVITCFYRLSKECPFSESNNLCVRLDEKLNILNFYRVELLLA
jgi:hypothetical protein